MEKRGGRFLIVLVALLSATGCGVIQNDAFSDLSASTSCASKNLSVITGDVGIAKVFMPDPMVGSGNPALTPFSLNLDNFTTEVKLSRLTGHGVLKGNYIEAVNELQCDGGFGAFDPKNQFVFRHSDGRFQEAMAYFFGDTYQSKLDSLGYLRSKDSVKIVVHCEKDDNAFFVRVPNSSGGVDQIVCLGDSVRSSGAYYGDDAIVTIHELQHATTLDNYSLLNDLNQFWYDEAGALNEAISDFMGLMFEDPYLSMNSQLDPRLFSRWALGSFDPRMSHLRGAHRCPVYDSRYPNCDSFPGFSASGSQTISYIYPDGMGWPYPNNFNHSNSLLQAFTKYPGQEEIHNAGILMLGTLWDAYSAIKANHQGNAEIANKMMTQLVLESLRHLPAADTRINHSPVTFVAFTSALLAYAEHIPDMNSADKAAIEQTLKSRGFHDQSKLTSNDWMVVGSGTNFSIQTTATPGVYILDDPAKIQRWFSRMGADPSLVTQRLDTGLNNRLDPGEVDAIWFDIQNNSPVTAGGVLLTVTSTDPDLQLLDDATNIGYMTLSGQNQAQIMYGKINGTSIVSSLSGIPTGNSYFKTNPFFQASWKTALWVKVRPTAPHGKVVTLQVRATPSNGVSSTQEFNVAIN